MWRWNSGHGGSEQLPEDLLQTARLSAASSHAMAAYDSSIFLGYPKVTEACSGPHSSSGFFQCLIPYVKSSG